MAGGDAGLRFWHQQLDDLCERGIVTVRCFRISAELTAVDAECAAVQWAYIYGKAVHSVIVDWPE